MSRKVSYCCLNSITSIHRIEIPGWKKLARSFGLSWQVVPKVPPELLNHPDSEKSERVFQALMQMKKLDIEGLQRAFAGEREPVATG
jgi:predicted 3-demethylubiquinone-9 3-methyltransferase (glyoxalase superfamily)